MGARSAGNPHSACDVAGTGDVDWTRWCDTRRRKGETTGTANFDINRRASPRPYRRGGGWRRGVGRDPRATTARQPSTLLMSGDGKRGDGQGPQATAPILDSTKPAITPPCGAACCLLEDAQSALGGMGTL